MKKLIFFSLILFTFEASAQYEAASSGSGGDKWYTGGGIVLSFSNNFTAVGVNPILGYNFTEKLSAGVGANISYFKSGSYATTIVGGNLFSRYLITDAIFAQTEFHMTSVDVAAFAIDDSESKREWIPAWFIGGGYRESIGDNIFINLTVLFDIIDDPKSPYSNPYITGGVSVGF